MISPEQPAVPHKHLSLTKQMQKNLEDDTKIEALWAQEAEERVHALDAGLIDAVPAEEVFSNFLPQA